jgi:hypothetical protein
MLSSLIYVLQKFENKTLFKKILFFYYSFIIYKKAFFRGVGQFIDSQFIDSRFIDTTVLSTASLSTDRFIDTQFNNDISI